MDFLSYWTLKEKPFENTGDPKFFYYSPNHKEALVRLIYVIKQQKGGALLAGSYGTGKTTIANEILFEISENQKYRSVYISNPLLTSRELIHEIAHQLDIDDEKWARLELRRKIEERLKEIADNDNHTIVVVDEAHLLTSAEVLEELRLMMNWQYKNRFLSTIIIMGQLELREIMNAMPQFKQRFAMYYVLKNLSEDETKNYIKHRLEIAGASRDIFTDSAIAAIYNSSEGKPRQINNVCDMSLLVGFMRKAETVDEKIIQEVVRDLGEEI